MPDDQNRLAAALPGIVLAVLVAVMVAGWLGFPYFQAWIAHNDCVATGRVNC